MRSAAVVVAALVMSACGDNGRLRTDAATPDVGEDSFVRITYVPPLPDHQRGDLPVIVQSASSRVILSTRTSGEGEAIAVIDDDAYVTVVGAINPLTDRQTIWTYEGVRPGDELVLDTSIQPSTTRFPIRLVVPREPNAAYYQMVTTCDTQQFDGGAMAGVEFRDCGEGLADILVLTYRDVAHSEADLDRYMLRLGVPVAPASTVTFPDAYQPIVPSTVTVSHLPATTTQPTITQFLVGESEQLYSQFRVLPVADPTSVTFRMPLPEGARVANDIALGAGFRLLAWQPPALETSIDVRDYEIAAAIDTPSFDAATRRITWTEAPSDNVANAALATLSAIERPIDWTIFSRRSSPSVEFPRLPPSILDPSLTFTVTRLTSLEIRAVFDDARRHLLGRSAGRLFPLVGERGSVASRQHIP